MPKQKLELTWIGKENRPRLEPRILLGDSARSFHTAARVSGTDIFDNRLIFGDNLLALKTTTGLGRIRRHCPAEGKGCCSLAQTCFRHGGKPWKYLLTSHQSIDDSKTLAGLAAGYTVASH